MAGYLLKQPSAHLLPEPIREDQEGNTFFTPSLAKQHREQYQKSPDRVGLVKMKGDRLSSRGMEVLQLIAQGKPNKQVAPELGVSFKTVDKHRQHLIAKLNIHDVAGLTYRCQRLFTGSGVVEDSANQSSSQGLFARACLSAARFPKPSWVQNWPRPLKRFCCPLQADSTAPLPMGYPRLAILVKNAEARMQKA